MTKGTIGEMQGVTRKTRKGRVRTKSENITSCHATIRRRNAAHRKEQAQKFLLTSPTENVVQETMVFRLQCTHAWPRTRIGSFNSPGRHDVDLYVATEQ